MENTSDKQGANCEGNKENNTPIRVSPMKNAEAPSKDSPMRSVKTIQIISKTCIECKSDELLVIRNEFISLIEDIKYRLQTRFSSKNETNIIYEMICMIESELTAPIPNVERIHTAVRYLHDIEGSEDYTHAVANLAKLLGV